MRFSLRTLMVILLLIGLPFSYAAREQRRAFRQRQAVTTIEEMGFFLEFDEDLPTRSPLSRFILGDDSWARARLVSNSLKGSKKDLTRSDITAIATLPNIEELDLAFTSVGDAQVAQLSCLKRLRILSLQHTQITDDCLSQIALLKNLEILHLHNTDVTDAGIIQLAGLTKLEDLYLRDTRVTQIGAERLQRELPRTSIYPRTWQSSKK